MASSEPKSPPQPRMCAGDACGNAATTFCYLCDVPLCYACAAMDSHICSRPRRTTRRTTSMRVGAAVAVQLLQDAAERGTGGVGAWRIHAEPGADAGWTWACACGACGAWIDNSYALVLVVATFANRHARCGTVVELADVLDTSPVQLAAGSA